LTSIRLNILLYATIPQILSAFRTGRSLTILEPSDPSRTFVFSSPDHESPPRGLLWAVSPPSCSFGLLSRSCRFAPPRATREWEQYGLPTADSPLAVPACKFRFRLSNPALLSPTPAETLLQVSQCSALVSPVFPRLDLQPFD